MFCRRTVNSLHAGDVRRLCVHVSREARESKEEMLVQARCSRLELWSVIPSERLGLLESANDDGPFPETMELAARRRERSKHEK
jgi:hypothetical protein